MFACRYSSFLSSPLDVRRRPDARRGPNCLQQHRSLTCASPSRGGNLRPRMRVAGMTSARERKTADTQKHVPVTIYCWHKYCRYPAQEPRPRPYPARSTPGVSESVLPVRPFPAWSALEPVSVSVLPVVLPRPRDAQSRLLPLSLSLETNPRPFPARSALLPWSLSVRPERCCTIDGVVTAAVAPAATTPPTTRVMKERLLSLPF